MSGALTVEQILERARAAADLMPPVEASALFAAAVRLGAEQGIAPRPSQLHLDEQGTLTLSREDPAPDRPGYLAPELASADAPRRNEPRVQVYAAGALGYEILTGRKPPVVLGPELSGPLADLVRLALAADRRERFGDLQQLLEAVEVVQPRRSAEAERQVLASLAQRAHRWSGVGRRTVDEAERLLRELSARVAALETANRLLHQKHDQLLRRLSALPPTGERPLVPGGPDRMGDAGPDVEEHAPPPATRRSADRFPVFAIGAILLGLAAAGATIVAARDGRLPRLQEMVARVLPREPSATTPAPSAAGEPASSASPTASPAPPPIPPAPAPTAPGPESTPSLPASTPPAVATPPSAATKGALEHVDDRPSDQWSLAVARAQVKRGEEALASGNPVEAAASFRAALADAGDLPEAVRGLGKALALLGKSAEARAAYQRYLQLSPAARDAAEIRRAVRDLQTSDKIGEEK